MTIRIVTRLTLLLVALAAATAVMIGGCPCWPRPPRATRPRSWATTRSPPSSGPSRPPSQPRPPDHRGLRRRPDPGHRPRLRRHRPDGSAHRSTGSTSTTGPTTGTTGLGRGGVRRATSPRRTFLRDPGARGAAAPYPPARRRSCSGSRISNTAGRADVAAGLEGPQGLVHRLPGPADHRGQLHLGDPAGPGPARSARSSSLAATRPWRLRKARSLIWRVVAVARPSVASSASATCSSLRSSRSSSGASPSAGSSAPRPRPTPTAARRPARPAPPKIAGAGRWARSAPRPARADDQLHRPSSSTNIASPGVVLQNTIWPLSTNPAGGVLDHGEARQPWAAGRARPCPAARRPSWRPTPHHLTGTGNPRPNPGGSPGPNSRAAL